MLRDIERHDLELLAYDASERAITHKLAEHLRRHLDPLFRQTPGGPVRYAVDCEYNRYGEYGDVKQLPWAYEVPGKNGGHYYTPNPDIIVHERGTQESNLLVVEVKTEFNAQPVAVLTDKVKLVGYHRWPTHYQNGLFLTLGIDDCRLQLREAVRVERAWVEPDGNGEKEGIWSAARGMLVKADPESKRPAFASPTAKMQKDAMDLMPDFEKAFGFTPIADELQWRPNERR